jgi:amidophosphoribosyltransferase
VALLRETGRAEVLDEVYRLCLEEVALPSGATHTNHVRKIYDLFTTDQLSAKIVELVTPKGLEWQGEVEILFQTIEALHAAVPDHSGDWYFTGQYPTPGGYRVLAQAYLNYYEKSAGRSY